ncbi:hypothetical protein Tco_1128144, partial [Tanacetum coccineum]
MLEGNGLKWLFDLDSLTQSMNYVLVVAGSSSNVSAGTQEVSESSTPYQQDQDCIIMPIWKDASYFEDTWNGYLRKGRKTKPKQQNRARNGKAGKRQSPVKPKSLKK